MHRCHSCSRSPLYCLLEMETIKEISQLIQAWDHFFTTFGELSPLCIQRPQSSMCHWRWKNKAEVRGTPLQASPQTVSDVAVPAVWDPASQLYKLNEMGCYVLIFNQNALPHSMPFGMYSNIIMLYRLILSDYIYYTYTYIFIYITK